MYGGEKDDEAYECFKFNNCSTIAFEQFQSYDLTAYSLYRLTLGESFDLVKIYFLKALHAFVNHQF